jgi:hypothetical protein
MAVGVTAIYLCILAAMFSLLKPQGLAATVTLFGFGVGAGTALILAVRWMGQHNVRTLFGESGRAPGVWPSSGMEGKSPRAAGRGQGEVGQRDAPTKP